MLRILIHSKIVLPREKGEGEEEEEEEEVLYLITSGN